MITRHKALTRLAVLLACASSLSNAQTPTPTPSFTLSASNITMPSSGTTSIPFTLTSVNGFAGSLALGVTAPTPPAGVKLPYLEIGGPAHLYPLTANGTFNGSMGVLSAIPVPVPVRFHIPGHPQHGARSIWSLAAALLLGLGLRRRSTLPTRLLLAAAMLTALTSITACRGPPTLTPGTYTYTLTATQETASQTVSASQSESTTFTLTVPSGIVTN